MSRFLRALPRRCFLLSMLAGSALIALTSLHYFDFETLPPFLLEKLPLKFEKLWLASLRVHVASSLVALPLCLLLSTRSLQRRPAWHRGLGKLAAAGVLFAVVPSGVVLAFDAKGGGLVTAGFLLSAAIVAGGMLHGVVSARRRDLSAHQRAMRHVVAQMSVAVSSRLMLVGLDLSGFDPDRAYVVSLWVPVLVSAAVAELVSRGGRGAPAVSRSPRFSLPSWFSLERIRREVPAIPALVRARAVPRPVARVVR